MKKFEKDLKVVLALNSGDNYGVYQDTNGLSLADLQFLSAKGLVELHRGGDNELFATPTGKGLTYFQDKRDLAAKAWKDRLLGFLTGAATTVAADLILRCLTGE